ncbi:MAG: amidohydrolase [Parasporobacterium sp.]|nr:amidohydrolase [Parasporobacterium sp.]
MSENRIIDVHTHITTPRFMKMLEDNNALWEDGFPIPKWNLKDCLDTMDELEICHAVLSESSPHPFYGNLQESIDVCRDLNDTAADAKSKHPDRFSFTATLPLPDINAACHEAVRCMDELGASGIKFASNSRGLYIGDPSLEPLMQELDKRGAVCTIHPTIPDRLNQDVFSAGPVPMFEFIADTTRAVINMIASGVIRRYPNIKWIVPHSGSFLPNIYPRFISIFDILDPTHEKYGDINVEADIKKLYFDLAGHPVPHLLDFLMTIADSSHILYGTDSPFPPKGFVVKGLQDFINMMDTREDLKSYKTMILHDNAAALILH